jgi:hypothetical protein
MQRTSARLLGPYHDSITVTRSIWRAGLSLLHDRFGDFPIGQTVQLAAGGIAALPNEESATGKRLPNTPDWQLNPGAEYAIPLSSGSVVIELPVADFESIGEGRTFGVTLGTKF